MPRCPPDIDLHLLAKEVGLNALALRYQYVFPLDTLLKRYKYQGELILAGPLAALIAPPPLTLLGASERSFRPVLIPVPASPARIKQRGYDHLHLMAQRYAKRFNLKMAYANRNQESASQAQLSRRDRKRNLTEVFQVGNLGKAVLLLDDVITTGATLSALAAQCREQGAEWVGAVVLARTPGPSELITL
jgi:ComF family protein